MFSRVGRLTTFGAQAVSNCPLRRDNIYQQPLKITAPLNDQLVNFAHNFSDSVRQRTTSFGNDPFLGLDDDQVIKELELLDLDSWHTKPRPPCSAPSDELEIDQFWDGKNITMEAWRPTDSWGQSSNQPQQQQGHGHSSSTEMMHDFSNFGDSMGAPTLSPLFKSPSKSSIDQLHRIDEFGMPPHQERKLSKFELDVETESKAVDWEAWNHYLESDDDVFKRPEAFFKDFKEEPIKEEPMMMTSSTYDSLPFHTPFSLSSSSSTANLFRLATPGAMAPAPTSSAMMTSQMDSDLFQSGPLTLNVVPKMENEVEEDFYEGYTLKEDSDEDYIPSTESRRHPRIQRKSMTPNSRSWTPDEWDQEELGGSDRVKYKKRGVVLKPSVDEETDRRRALNRIAAVRYREKKRAEKMGRKREFQDVIDHNRVLLQKERQLRREIASMKKELRKMGAIIQ